MDLFMKMLSLQGQLFAMMAVGWVIRRIRLISVEGRKALSELLIHVILPCNIVASFTSGTSVTEEFYVRCGLVFLISALTQVFAVVISRPLFRRFDRERQSIMTYAMICSNSSYIGLPLAEALFGSVGVMYTAIFQIPLRFQMWTSGLALFSREKAGWKENLRKLALHPCILAVFLGLALMVLPVGLPAPLQSIVQAFSRCTTPLSMLVIGSILSDTDLHDALSPAVLYCTFLRLLAFPLTIYLLLLPFRSDPVIMAVNVLLGAMPAGNITAILADKYGCNPRSASQVVFTSTLLSLLTLPIISLLL